MEPSRPETGASPVRPSPIKKIWSRPGEIELNVVPLSRAGPAPDGLVSLRKTPARPLRWIPVGPEMPVLKFDVRL